MIDLFSVKFNGQYDDVGCEPSIDNGTFLCCKTGNYYQKGYSYQITNGQPLRIETVQDCKILTSIYPTIQNTCEWLNNWFTVRRNYEDYFEGNIYGSNGAYHELAQTPSTGDLCKIRTTDNWNYLSLYSFYFVSYVSVTENGITGDNPKYNDEMTYFFYPMHLPDDVEKAISNLIYYDVFTRGEVSDLKSENIGNYSYTKEDVHIGSLSYPSELIGGLEACYRKIRFVQ